MEQPLSRTYSPNGAMVSLALEQALHSWGAVLDLLPVGACACDRDGGLVRYNERAAEIWGRWPSLDEFRPHYGGGEGAFTATGAPLAPEDLPIARALREGRALRQQELMIERRDGQRITLLADVEPLFDSTGELVGAISCFQDITGIKQSDDQMSERDRRARELLDALPAAIYTTDNDGKITFFNKASVDMAGRTPTLGTDEWCVTWKLYTTDGEFLAHDQCPMAQAVKEGKAIRGVEAIAERPDGTRVPFVPYPTPLRDESGAMIGAVNMLVDVSALRQAEQQQRVLIDELNHRVKNTLASVQSIASHTLRGSSVPKEVREAFETRLFALSSAHDELSRRHWESADIKTLAEKVLGPYGNVGAHDRVHTDGPSVELRPQVVLTLSLVLSELAINAAKYGALSAPNGKVSLTWKVKKVKDGPHLVIDWTESGGPPVTEPDHKGFGTRLLHRGIAGQLGGHSDLSFHKSGVRCTMDIPLASPNAE